MARPMVEPLTPDQRREARPRLPLRPSAACLTAARWSWMAAQKGSAAAAEVHSSR